MNNKTSPVVCPNCARNYPFCKCVSRSPVYPHKDKWECMCGTTFYPRAEQEKEYQLKTRESRK